MKVTFLPTLKNTLNVVLIVVFSMIFLIALGMGFVVAISGWSPLGNDENLCNTEGLLALIFGCAVTGLFAIMATVFVLMFISIGLYNIIVFMVGIIGHEYFCNVSYDNPNID